MPVQATWSDLMPARVPLSSKSRSSEANRIGYQIERLGMEGLADWMLERCAPNGGSVRELFPALEFGGEPLSNRIASVWHELSEAERNIIRLALERVFASGSGRDMQSLYAYELARLGEISKALGYISFALHHLEGVRQTFFDGTTADAFSRNAVLSIREVGELLFRAFWSAATQSEMRALRDASNIASDLLAWDSKSSKPRLVPAYAPFAVLGAYHYFTTGTLRSANAWFTGILAGAYLRPDSLNKDTYVFEGETPAGVQRYPFNLEGVIDLIENVAARAMRIEQRQPHVVVNQDRLAPNSIQLTRGGAPSATDPFGEPTVLVNVSRGEEIPEKVMLE